LVDTITDPATLWNALAAPEGVAAWLLSVRQQ
jgi:hypothetical protein